MIVDMDLLKAKILENGGRVKVSAKSGVCLSIIDRLCRGRYEFTPSKKTRVSLCRALKTNEKKLFPGLKGMERDAS